MDWQRVLLAVVRVYRVLTELLGKLAFGLYYRTVPSDTLPPVANLLLMESASALAAKIRQGKVSSEEVVRAFIKQIEVINPTLNCVVDKNFDEAIEKAKECDLQLKDGSLNKEDLAKEKPFFGVPFTNKDSMAVKGMRHTAGLYGRKDIVSSFDADVVALMKGAGAIHLCVTNVSELCLWWESANTIYGTTCNPYDTRRIVGGSSGGEACLQAACGSPLGLGSDIGGSIRMPAFFCGVFGHKPGRGLVSNAGQEPPAVGRLEEMLSSGPLCRHAADLRPCVKVLTRGNPDLQLDTKVAMKDLRVFYIEDDSGSAFTSPVCAELKGAMKAVVRHLKLTHGVTPVKLRLESFRNAVPMFLSEMGSEPAGTTMCREMVMRQGEIWLGWEWLKWAVGRSKHTFPGLMLCLMEKLPKSAAVTASVKAEVVRLRREITDQLGSDGVLLCPPHPTLAPLHGQPNTLVFNYAYTAVFNVLGLPVSAVPLGLSRTGLPMGVQVAANFNQDHLCLSVAEDLERAFGGWVCPTTVL